MPKCSVEATVWQSLFPYFTVYYIYLSYFWNPVTELDPPALGLKSYQIQQLPIKRKQERLHLDPALASRLEPFQLKPGLSASTLTGKLDVRDNKFTLKASLIFIIFLLLLIVPMTLTRKSLDSEILALFPNFVFLMQFS